MHFSAHFVAAVLAALPLAAGHPQEFTRSTGDLCQSYADPALLAIHDKILSGDKATLSMIAKGEAVIQDALARSERGLRERGADITVTKRDNGEFITLKTWFHVVYNANTTRGGYLTESSLQEQLKVLNAAYKPSNLAFELAGTDYTENAVWANNPYNNELPMKTALHKGDSRTLNLYFAPGPGVGGRCEFPNMNAYGETALKMDGCVVGSRSVPGNTGGESVSPGWTAVHEVGHWFGLLHTFQGGCSDLLGDRIADTPAEASPNWGPCPPGGRDTCPELPGFDPTDNFMDYSNDNACQSRFTTDQTTRMRSILALIRLGPLW